MLAPFSKIHTDMPSIVKEWHRLTRQVEPVLDLFSAVALHHSLYQSAQFLFLVQGLEVYYALSGRFPNERKTWALRLRELFEAHRDIADLLFGNLSEMAERIANTRNELIHGKNTKPPELLLDDHAISHVAWSLESFLWIVLLRELGINGEPIQRLVTRATEAEVVNLRD